VDAAVKSNRKVNGVGWTERDGGVISVVGYQLRAANLSLDDFKGPVVLPALPNRSWQHNPAEQGLRPPTA
jgi:hypothetical protein